MSFSWVPFYREVAQTVLEYENRQGELLTLLREMKATGLPTIPLEENQADGTMTPLEVMEPFTFLANIARVETPQSLKICAFLKTRWSLQSPLPTDFNGRAAIQPRGGGSWFFAAVGDGRGPEEISRLWTLARQAFDGKVEDLDASLFALCLTHRNLAIRKLTTGLSWFSPKGFLPLGDPMLPFLKAKGAGFDARGIERHEIGAYKQLMDAAHSLTFDNLALVKESREWKPVDAILPPILKRDVALNQILYGPPGTGKTFNSINRAVEIIDGLALEDRDECKARFDELRALGQIEFVTFHQSFSYEEFIEGLRPVLDEDGDGQARYEIRDGVLKEMALKATEAAYGSTHSRRPTFDELWQLFLSGLESNDVVPGLGEGRYKIVVNETSVKGNNIAGDAAQDYSVSLENLRFLWENLPFNARPDSPTLRGILGKGFACNLAGAIFLALQKIEEQAFPALTKQLNFGNAPRFVLIVDEINRGNISKILGELITLLEDDKRIGKPNELRVKLPVSQDSFALPPNLYVLGTMNTADKSLALLDIALRRRFSFVEMPPRAELFPDFARETLQTLNLHLEAALDREHRLGHAYFIGCADIEAFDRTFRDKIIPLLQEFFYNDWESLRAVLGESGNGTFIKALPALPGIKTRTKWRWWFDADGSEELPCLAALKANYARLATGDGETP
ncbi:MAG: AAA family ATPase [Armatimonadetes bacterium]|nr:AAA family ATPase [Armatimonadota bacterium]